MAQLYNIPIKSFNSGLSESKYRGIEGSFYRGIGIDISEKGIVKANQTLSKDSGATVTDLCKFSVAGSDGNTYWFGDTGKIYKRTSGGTWSLLTTDSNGEIYGAAEHSGYIYWATSDNLARCDITSADWDSDKNETYGTFTNKETPHPMIVHLLDLYIGDGKDVVKSSDVTSSVLDLAPDMTIQALGSYGIDLIMGARKANSNQSGIFRWNCNDDSWNYGDAINEDSIDAIVTENQTNSILVFAGSSGNIYKYNGSSLGFQRQIDGDYSTSAKSKVNADAVANFRDNILFGISNSTSNPSLQGIYSFYPSQYPLLNLEYPISTDNTSNIEIGSILVVGQDIFVSWKDTTDGTSYGVDSLDWTTKYSGAYLETLQLNPDPQYYKGFHKVITSLESLPSDCSIKIYYKKDGDASYSQLGDTIDTDSAVISNLQEYLKDVSKIQFKIELITNANTTPEIDNVNIIYQRINKI